MPSANATVCDWCKRQISHGSDSLSTQLQDHTLPKRSDVTTAHNSDLRSDLSKVIAAEFDELNATQRERYSSNRNIYAGALLAMLGVFTFVIFYKPTEQSKSIPAKGNSDFESFSGLKRDYRKAMPRDRASDLNKSADLYSLYPDQISLQQSVGMKPPAKEAIDARRSEFDHARTVLSERLRRIEERIARLEVESSTAKGEADYNTEYGDLTSARVSQERYIELRYSIAEANLERAKILEEMGTLREQYPEYKGQF